MTDAPVDHTKWFKSSYSSAWGSCVETRFDSENTLVRDSKDRRPDSPFIKVSARAWTAFLGSITYEHEHQ
jgi:hypothetical protein